jgi:4-diphosphocytidyl-2C-methyl-D-erythritol kinase
MGFERFSKPIKKRIGFQKHPKPYRFSGEHQERSGNLMQKKLCPEITGILETISKQGGCLFSRMSGSGATCFGIFETSDKANTAKENILKDNPSYWVAVG